MHRLCKEKKIHKIFAGVYGNNISSIKVLMKNKFKIEASLQIL